MTKEAIVNGKSLNSISETLGSGTVPPRTNNSSLLRSIVLPAALVLSFGLGACIGDEPTENLGIDGRADTQQSDPTGSCLGPSEICDDGEDNDLDGYVDCIDYDCEGNDACSSMDFDTAPMEQDCENGQDDDGDGRVDCIDFDCREHCACWWRTTYRVCNRDDDCPGVLCIDGWCDPCPDGECQDLCRNACDPDEICVSGECIVPPTNCFDLADCTSCLEMDGCGWCSSTESCVFGDYFGPSSDGVCDWSDYDYYDC